MTHILNLKPCPFCGRDVNDYVIEYQGSTCVRLRIECCINFDIDASNFYYVDGKKIHLEGDAIDIWNSRKLYMEKMFEGGPE